MWSGDRESRDVFGYLRDEREVIRSLIGLMESRQRSMEIVQYQRGRLGGRSAASRGVSRAQVPLRVSRVNPRAHSNQGPTAAQQVENATETMTFSEARGNEEDVDMVCPITRGTYEQNTEVLRIRGCGHFATAGPMRRWLTERGTCPVCRATVAQVATETGTEQGDAGPGGLVEQLTRMIAGDITGSTVSHEPGQTVFEYRMDLPSA